MQALARRRRGRARRRGVCPSGSARRWRCHVVWCRVAEDAWERCEGTDRPLAQDREASPPSRQRQPLYEQVADAILTDGARAGARGRCPRWRAARAARAGRGWPGRRRLRRVPGIRRPRALLGGRLLAAEGRRFCVARLRRAGALRARRCCRRGRRSRWRGARPQRRWPRPSGCCASWPGRGRATTTCWRSAAASSATWPASAPPPTSAASRSSRRRRRWSPRWTPPTAARPAWTCPRRRTTSAPTTSPAPCSPIRRRSPPCRPRSWRPASPRW